MLSSGLVDYDIWEPSGLPEPTQPRLCLDPEPETAQVAVNICPAPGISGSDISQYAIVESLLGCCGLPSARCLLPDPPPVANTATMFGPHISRPTSHITLDLWPYFARLLEPLLLAGVPSCETLTHCNTSRFDPPGCGCGTFRIVCRIARRSGSYPGKKEGGRFRFSPLPASNPHTSTVFLWLLLPGV